MISRFPPVVLGALVALVTLGSASLAWAHQEPGAERAGAGSPPPGWTDSRAPAQRAAHESVQDHALGGPAADGVEAWRAPAAGPGAATSRRQAGPIMGALVATLIGAFVVALGGRAARSWLPRIAASVVGVALAVLTFETGVHSVHHLGDEAGAAQCSVASASTHLAGTPEEGPALRAPAPLSTGAQSLEIAPAVETPFRYHPTRAPPTPSDT